METVTEKVLYFVKFFVMYENRTRYAITFVTGGREFCRQLQLLITHVYYIKPRPDVSKVEAKQAAASYKSRPRVLPPVTNLIIIN